MDYIIAPQEGKKGRSFMATCVAMMTANSLWEGSGSDNIRPVFAVFAGTDGELKPFMTNLRLGRKADLFNTYRNRSGDRIEFLKSEGFYMTWQRETLGSLATIFHPDLFRVDPGMVDPRGIQFILTVPQDWYASQRLEKASVVQHVRRLMPTFKLTDEELEKLVPAAYLFAAYLDRRTRCPLIADGRFYLQILCSALEVGMASFPGTDVKYGRTDGFCGRFGFHAVGLDDIGISHAIAVHTPHTAFEEFLANEVTKYFAAVGPAPRVKAPVKEAVQYDLFETA